MLAFNLGVALSQMQHDVIAVDANIYSPDLTQYADISSANYLNDQLDDNKNIEDAIAYHPSGLKIIPSMAEEVHDEEKHGKINNALLNLHGKADIVLVDSLSHNPALYSVLHHSDEILLVSNDDYHNVAKTRDFIKDLEEKGLNVIGVVLNKRGKAKKADIESILGKKILAELSSDNKVVDSINKRQPVVLMHPSSSLSKAVNELAEMISIQEEPSRKK
jgi:MinD-like ATPase involved in chromosome partitioning or flagellar assembly